MANLEGIKVQIYIKEGTGDDINWSYVTSENTAVDGTYTLSGLGPGTYKLKISDPDGVYLTEYFDGKTTLDLATEIVVAAAAVLTGKDVIMGAAATISGAITTA